MSLVPKNNIHFNLQNFGADKIYVISEKDSYRRKEFIKAWEWSDLEYEFVDAIMGKDLDIKSMIQDGRLDTFIDPSGNLSKNIIAVALSHQKAYEMALDEFDSSNSENRFDSNGNPLRYFLFLEDDARPTTALIDSIQAGEYPLLIKDIKKFSFDILWLGRAIPNIRGRYLNNRLQHIRRFEAPGAQSYMINVNSLRQLFDSIKDINMPADLLLDKEDDILHTSLATYQSLIGQMGTMIHSFTGDKDLPDDHISNLYKSQTQLPIHLWRKDIPKLERVNPDMYEFIEDVEDFDYDEKIGYPDNCSALGGVDSLSGEPNNHWRKIIFKKNLNHKGLI